MFSKKEINEIINIYQNLIKKVEKKVYKFERKQKIFLNDIIYEKVISKVDFVDVVYFTENDFIHSIRDDYFYKNVFKYDKKNNILFLGKGKIDDANIKIIKKVNNYLYDLSIKHDVLRIKIQKTFLDISKKLNIENKEVIDVLVTKEKFFELLEKYDLIFQEENDKCKGFVLDGMFWLYLKKENILLNCVG